MNSYFEVNVLRKHNVPLKGRIPTRLVVKASTVKRAATLVLSYYRDTKNTSCVKLIRVFKLHQPRGEGILTLTKLVTMRTYKIVAGRLQELAL